MEQERQNFPHRIPSSSSAKIEEVNAADHQLPPRAPVVDEPREQDQYLPIANITRIMRQILPPHAKISDGAKETVQESTSEYISFITQEANDRCQREKRKTVTAEDLIFAFSKLGFDHYVEPLSLYLQKYREIETDRTSLRGELPAHLRRDSISCPSDAGPSQVNGPNVNIMLNVGFGRGGSTTLGGLYGGNSGQAVAGPSGGVSLPRGPSGSGMQPSQSSGRGRTRRPSPLSRGRLLGPSGGAFGPDGMSVGPVAPPRYVKPSGTTPTGAATGTDSWYNDGSMSARGSSSSQATINDFDHFLEFKCESESGPNSKTS